MNYRNDLLKEMCELAIKKGKRDDIEEMCQLITNVNRVIDYKNRK